MESFTDSIKCYYGRVYKGDHINVVENHIHGRLNVLKILRFYDLIYRINATFIKPPRFFGFILLFYCLFISGSSLGGVGKGSWGKHDQMIPKFLCTCKTPR